MWGGTSRLENGVGTRASGGGGGYLSLGLRGIAGGAWVRGGGVVGLHIYTPVNRKETSLQKPPSWAVQPLPWKSSTPSSP